MRSLFVLVPALAASACLEPTLTQTNDPPVVVIQRPGDGAVFEEGALVEFQAKVTDDGDVQAVDVNWTDNGSTVLIEGVNPDADGIVTFATAELSMGSHAITVDAVDASNLSAEDSVQIEIAEVVEAPNLTILRPDANGRGEVGTDFVFEAAVSDPQDDPQDLLVEITSDLDGSICVMTIESDGTALCAAPMRTEGNHRLQFTVTDTDLNSTSKVTVLPVDPVPEEPSISIVAPTAGTSILFQTLFQIDAVVGDRQDAAQNLNVVVTSDVEGTVCPMSVDAQGNATCTGSLAEIGNQYLTFRVTDTDGNTAEAIALVQVVDSSGIDDDGDGFSEIQGDCNDNNATVYPGATEQPNGVDDDCDTFVDEGTVLADDDGDGYCESQSQPCSDGAAPGDCDDMAFTINPGAGEQCNGVDDDCDNQVDEAGASGCLTYFADADGDGFGDSNNSACVCAAGFPYTSLNGGDCDDSQATTFPGAPELADGEDNNCNGTRDEGTSLVDDDGDGYCDSTTASCTDGSQNGDCNDGNATVNPGSPEVCGDGLDNNCSGVADEPGAVNCTTWYVDGDGDGYGDSASGQCLCSNPGGGATQTGGDCNDAAILISPSSNEIGDGIDNNCDGVADEGTPLFDNDGDGFCQASACTSQPGGTPSGGDCNDGNANINPAATEVCSNGVDDNCNNSQNEGQNTVGCQTFYEDRDGDGFGAGAGRCYCQAQGLYTRSNDDDCYDVNADARPGQTRWFSSNRGDGSFDYNCDNRSEQRWDERYDCGCPGSTLNPEAFEAGWDGSPAACGQSRSYVSSCSYSLNFNVPNPFWPLIGPRTITECLSNGPDQVVTRQQTCH